MYNKIKKTIKPLLDVILALYNNLLYQLIIVEDKQRRNSLYKQRNPDTSSMLYKVQMKIKQITSNLTPNKFSLAEQRLLVETLITSTKYGNPVTEPFEFLSELNKKSLKFRNKCLEVRESLNFKPLFEALKGKDIFPDEYISSLMVAERTGNFLESYEYIHSSILDKQKRRMAFLVIMSQPIFTGVVVIGIELYIALKLVPDLLVNIPAEEAPKTLKSYIKLRDNLLYNKLYFFTQIFLWSLTAYIIYAQQATKYLFQLILLQLPFFPKYIIQWEMSKFFSSMNSMIKSGANLKESLEISVNLINNKVIRASLLKDIKLNVEKSNNLYEIFENSVYIDDRVMNQLYISFKSGSDSSEVLKSVSDDYADSMKRLLDSPMGIVIPMMLLVGSVYLFTRLLPLLTEITSFIENIGG